MRKEGEDGNGEFEKSEEKFTAEAHNRRRSKGLYLRSLTRLEAVLGYNVSVAFNANSVFAYEGNRVLGFLSMTR